MDSTKLKERAKEILKECEKMGYTWDDVGTLLAELMNEETRCRRRRAETAFKMYEK